MERQLVLIEASGAEWRLDERTKEIGKEGIRQAREALRDALRKAHEAASDTSHPTAA